MKKMICMILAIVLAAGCVGSLAEGASSSEDSKFLQIKEGVTAPVFADPKDETPVDQLEGGTLCCAVGDPFTSDNKEFLLIFYLNNQKKGALGYIDPKDAQALTEQELAELMEDPDKLNEVLDLVDALNSYLKTDNDNTAEPSSGNGKNAAPVTPSALSQLYDEAINALSGLLSSDITGDLVDAAKNATKDALEVGSEKFGEAKKTVEENWPAVEKKAGEILDTVKDKVDEILPGAEEKATDFLDGVKEKYEEFKKDPDAALENLQKELNEELDKLNVSSGNAVGSMLDEVAKLSDQLENLVNSDTFTLIKSAIPAVAQNYREKGLSEETDNLIDALVRQFLKQSSSGDD